MEKLSVSSAKIKVIKCSFETYWYNDKIGQEYYIEDYSHRDYYVRINGHLRGILRKDAEFLNKKNPLI